MLEYLLHPHKVKNVSPAAHNVNERENVRKRNIWRFCLRQKHSTKNTCLSILKSRIRVQLLLLAQGKNMAEKELFGKLARGSSSTVTVHLPHCHKVDY